MDLGGFGYFVGRLDLVTSSGRWASEFAHVVVHVDLVMSLCRWACLCCWSGCRWVDLVTSLGTCIWLHLWAGGFGFFVGRLDLVTSSGSWTGEFVHVVVHVDLVMSCAGGFVYVVRQNVVGSISLRR